ncbi:50S ribosomal protein L10 [TM7 phylum sp. oral taxon 352]|jgi:Ribosomal protein L10|nr:50S ribosomal protein L10 [TM7 phylum sp. oral taxon 352]
MAISRDKKQTLVAELTELLKGAKGTAFARYQTLTVADLQELRKAAREAGVVIKVVKNRLVRVALQEIDTSLLVGQLVYAVSAEDEVMPAKVLDTFAKTHPALQLAGGFSGEGLAISEADVKALAGLPSKDQLVAQVVSQLLSPVHDTVNALGGNLHGLLDGIEAKAAA